MTKLKVLQRLEVAVIKNKRILKCLLMMVVSLLLILNFSICVSASSGYDWQEADACITISQRVSVKGGRNFAGLVTGGENLSDTKHMMHGSQGNVGVVPKEIADKMRGKQFSSFDAFREDFWKTVADSSYASELSTSNIGRMKNGYAPRVIKEQRYGELKSYILHHKIPIHDGGGVYDLDNIVIVTPRMHQKILDKAYHFGH